MTPRLTIELLPQEQWGANLYQLLQGKRWDTVKKETYRRAGNRCEICGGVGTRVAVQAHEVWEYDEAAGTQRLVRMIALCPACHDAKHFGRAQAGGRGAEALAHLAEVNGWTQAEAKAHVSEQSAVWRQRNTVHWTLDVSILSEYGIEPPSAS